MPGHTDAYVCSPSKATFHGNSEDGHFSYTCAHCGEGTHGAVLARWPGRDGTWRLWLMCSLCGEPSVADRYKTIYPVAQPGPVLEGLPPEVHVAYDEARRALGVSAFTACELLCRKILMHVAVDIAESSPGESFVSYIDDLASAGYVTPPMKPWVDLIRKHGNEATHELPSINRDRATGTLLFTAELLRLSYEMDHFAKRFAPTPDGHDPK